MYPLYNYISGIYDSFTLLGIPIYNKNYTNVQIFIIYISKGLHKKPTLCYVTYRFREMITDLLHYIMNDCTCSMIFVSSFIENVTQCIVFEFYLFRIKILRIRVYVLKCLFFSNYSHLTINGHIIFCH